MRSARLTETSRKRFPVIPQWTFGSHWKVGSQGLCEAPDREGCSLMDATSNAVGACGCPQRRAVPNAAIREKTGSAVRNVLLIVYPPRGMDPQSTIIFTR